MNIVTMDNNLDDLSQLADAITTLFPKCKIQAFTDPILSAKYVDSNPVDIVFLTDTMRPANSFKLVQVLRRSSPNLPIVMLSTSNENKAAAMNEAVNGFLVKPVTTQALSSVIHDVLL